tara:strand:+ start:924 stop:1079 length:156 start_codon:yes stop_codon:yes gene_type:complete
MIEQILLMLEIAKKNKLIGKYTHVALGKYNLPINIEEGYKQINLDLWRKKQ